MNKIYDLIIIGGGAAGLFCGAAHTSSGNKAILEAGKSFGIKLLMSGSGQCNITHSGDIKNFPAAYGSAGKKLRGCLYKHNNDELCNELETLGIETFTREDGKIFPKSMDAHQVRDGLVRKCQKNHFQLITQCKVSEILQIEGGYEIKAGNGSFISKNIVIATGGCSYKSSGSDGSMFKILESGLGISIVKPRPALVPIKVENYVYSELSGISFDNVITSITEPNGKQLATLSGPLLLTHTEFSGPAILDISKYAETGKFLVINYLGIDFQECKERIVKTLNNSKANPVNVLAEEFNLPKRFVSSLIERVGTKTKELATTLTADKYLISGTSGFNKAMVTTGGVALDEMNLKEMKCKKLPGIYIIGEALDVDGRTGGYNLQFCYSSACAAATAIDNK